jgi:hypothetical protein
VFTIFFFAQAGLALQSSQEVISSNKNSI